MIHHYGSKWAYTHHNWAGTCKTKKKEFRDIKLTTTLAATKYLERLSNKVTKQLKWQICHIQEEETPISLFQKQTINSLQTVLTLICQCRFLSKPPKAQQQTPFLDFIIVNKGYYTAVGVRHKSTERISCAAQWISTLLWQVCEPKVTNQQQSTISLTAVECYTEFLTVVY